MRTQLCEVPMESYYEKFQITKQWEAVRGVHAVWSLWEASVDLFDDLPEFYGGWRINISCLDPQCSQCIAVFLIKNHGILVQLLHTSENSPPGVLREASSSQIWPLLRSRSSLYYPLLSFCCLEKTMLQVPDPPASPSSIFTVGPTLEANLVVHL